MVFCSEAGLSLSYSNIPEHIDVLTSMEGGVNHPQPTSRSFCRGAIAVFAFAPPPLFPGGSLVMRDSGHLHALTHLLMPSACWPFLWRQEFSILSHLWALAYEEMRISTLGCPSPRLMSVGADCHAGERKRVVYCSLNAWTALSCFRKKNGQNSNIKGKRRGKNASHQLNHVSLDFYTLSKANSNPPRTAMYTPTHK